MSSAHASLTREAGSSVTDGRSFRRRPSLAHILIALAALLAFAFNYLALQDRESVHLVAVASRSLPAGTEIDASSIDWIEINSSFASLESLIVEAETPFLLGSITAKSIAAGELVGESALVPNGAASGLRTMSVPVDPAHAAGSSLVVADRVDVISIVDGVPTFVATDLEVVDVSERNQSGVAGSGSNYVLLAVTAEEALALAMAIEDGSIEIIRSSGAEPISRSGDGS